MLLHFFKIAQTVTAMDVETVKQLIEQRHNLSTALGMDFISTPEKDVCKAAMTVVECNCLPFGFHSGGTSVAENMAWTGALFLYPSKICVGIRDCSNHAKAMSEGETVTDMARLVSIGSKVHVWDADIADSSDELISIVHVIIYIITLKIKTYE